MDEVEKTARGQLSGDCLFEIDRGFLEHLFNTLVEILLDAAEQPGMGIGSKGVVAKIVIAVRQDAGDESQFRHITTDPGNFDTMGAALHRYRSFNESLHSAVLVSGDGDWNTLPKRPRTLLDVKAGIFVCRIRLVLSHDAC